MATAAPTYFVYVVRNRAGILYTGIAKDVAARCLQHNGGCGARFTRGRGPWTVVHTEGPLAHGDALRRELQVKADRRLKAAIKANARAGAKARTQPNARTQANAKAGAKRPAARGAG